MPLHMGISPALTSIIARKLPFSVSTIYDRRVSGCHWHKYTQIWYTVSGSYTQTVNGVALRQTAGCATLVFPYTMHGMDSSRADLKNTRVICIDIFEDLFGKNIAPYLPLSFSASAFDKRLLPPFVRMQGKAKDQTDILCEEILAEYNRKQDMNQQRIFTAIGKLLELFAATATEPISGDKAMRIYEQTATISEVTAFVAENTNRSITLTEISRYAAMSQRSFCDKFKVSTGQTFYGYHNHSRMATAIRQLRFTTKPLTEIADTCGFYDLSHFAHMFKEYFGVTPGVLREQMLNRSRRCGEYFHENRMKKIGWLELLDEREIKRYHDHSIGIIED